MITCPPVHDSNTNITDNANTDSNNNDNYNNNNITNYYSNSNNHNIYINSSSCSVYNILCSTTDLQYSHHESIHEVEGPPAASSETNNVNPCN